jgi:kumamolisin
MNQYLEDHNGKALGEINPLLYRAAQTTPAAFHDVTLGADALDSAGRGYDLVTGLGTPNVAVLVTALGKAQK